MKIVSISLLKHDSNTSSADPLILTTAADLTSYGFL